VIKTHALRHTCASLMIAAGENPKAAAELLGHLDASITLKTYTHTSPLDRRQAVQRLGIALQEGIS
jgi:integrase